MLKKLLKNPPIELEMVGVDILENGQICCQYAVNIPDWLALFEWVTGWTLPKFLKIYKKPFMTRLGEVEDQAKKYLWKNYPRSYDSAIALTATPEGIQETLTFWDGSL